MSYISVSREQVARVQGFGPEYYCMTDNRAPQEFEEDWSDLRWALEHLPHTLESERILQALVMAENAASEYLDEHGPAIPRPAPDWLTDEED